MRKISPEELKKILDRHKEWVKSGFKRGKRAELSEAELRRANLHGAELSWANLSEADLGEAKLRDADLSGADLSGADLSWADLRGADVSRAKLRDADLSWANLNEAGLSGADLRDADLFGADLSEADLKGANLIRAGLGFANMSRAKLRGADLSEAACARTLFADIDFSETKGLDSIEHVGPSTVGVDTLFKSKGEIPRVFLEGCGVPEPLIDYLPSLVHSLDLFPYYTCFISYAEPDDAFSRKLYDDLKERKIRCWRWREDAILGKSLRGEIDEAVRVYDKLIVICSRDSLDRVPVQTEIQRALQKEAREGREVLFPIAIDDYLLGDWEHALKADLVEKVVGEFPKSGKGKAYEKELGRLVEGLKKDFVKGGR